MANQQPIQRFRAGSVSCGVFENQVNVRGQPQVLLKASIARRYKDADGTWRSSQSFSRSDLPLAIHCLEQAFAWIIREEQKRSEAENGAAEEFIAD